MKSKPNAKHLPKSAKRFTKINPFAAAALRLLLFTGCRLREILNLRWEHVDLERGLLLLPDSKTGRKTIILNAPALTVLNGLERVGPFVVPGDNPDSPRPDLKRPWEPSPSDPLWLACACTICGTPTQASVLVADSACRSLAGCLAMPRPRPPRGMRTLITIHCGARQKRLQGELLRRLTVSAREQWLHSESEQARSNIMSPRTSRKRTREQTCRDVSNVPQADIAVIRSPRRRGRARTAVSSGRAPSRS